MSVKEKCFYDVKKTLFVQNEAVDITLKYSQKNKKVTVQLNNNEPFHIYHQKYKKSQIMRDESTTKWCKYVEKKIKKEINKSSYKKSYIITLCQGYSVDDLDTSNINIHVKKTLQLKSKMVFAYLTPKDMIKLKNKNSNKICEVQTDSYAYIPEQNGYPVFKHQSRLPSVRINCGGDGQNPSNSQIGREWIGWEPMTTRTTQIPNANELSDRLNGIGREFWDVREERNQSFTEYLVYLFIIDTGIARHSDLSINYFRSRNFVPNNAGNVISSDWVDRNGHGTHVAGTAAGRNVGVTYDREPHQVISLKVLPDIGIGLSTWIFDAQNYIIQFARKYPRASIVVNMSLGMNNGAGNIMNNPMYFGSPDRIVVVCSAGNNGEDVELRNTQPANSPGSITVANSVTNAIRRCDSSFGPRIDIFAPGTNIRSTWLNNQLRQQNGTSMAAPAVAGAAVIILRLLLLEHYIRLLRVGVINGFDRRGRRNTNDRRRVLCFLRQNATNLTCDDFINFGLGPSRIDGCQLDVAMDSTTRRFLNLRNIFRNLNQCPENVLII